MALTSNAILVVQCLMAACELSVKNAATLWNLMKQEKMANTKVVLSGAIRDAGPPMVARSRPLPLTPDSASYAAQTPPTADASSYNAP